MILKNLSYLVVETNDLVDGEGVGMRLLRGRRPGRGRRCSNHPHVLQVKTDQLIHQRSAKIADKCVHIAKIKEYGMIQKCKHNIFLNESM